ncbi:tetratricopeptide repeat protein [uncultured Polaribacter sp.]|uniref:tetratricopeptide repeat protein n=1 Tax=uncultured Polaribacter sp. TaxID=174711 RepID=UPI002608A4EE|nr:tetratricopeptide repeat protein [uncultured Polaribacter sp.]
MTLRFFINLLFLNCLLCTPFISSAQQTIADTGSLKEYTNAMQLYNHKAYAVAQKTFTKVKTNTKLSTNIKADASFFEAMCAIKLNQPNADKKVVAFVEEYPNSPKKNIAFFNVANYYFANKKAAYALKWFLKIDTAELSIENKKELNFKTGYALLVTGNLTKAKNRFLPLINDAKYGDDSRYYYGFIAYKLEDYGVAESTLKEIADNESYRAEISYYLLDISFKAGKFKRCVAVGKKLYPTIDRKLKSDVAKIIGESYFNLKQYAKAIPYLKEYKGKKGKWNNTDFYQLGYAYYKQNDFRNAIANFNKIIDEKNAVSQNAYYHLGECYMNLDKKLEALNAFKSASEMRFNKKIQEDAALNYAKLSYDEGNPFKPVAEVLQNYLKTYPTSAAYKEINLLVVTSFLTQNNFDGALQFLAKKKSAQNTKLSREVSLYRGLQLFNQSKYEQALPFFAESKKADAAIIIQKTQYWEAESLYRLNNYKEALNKFSNLNDILKSKKSKDFKLITYNMGYSLFKLKEYNKAANMFTTFLQKDSITDAVKYDALIRLGDSYYASTNYNKAINSYKKVTDNAGLGADYAQYQIGMAHGFLNQDNQKITALKNVVNNYQVSNLKDDALYQLANTYLKLKDVENANNAFDRLAEKHPKSIFLPRALLRQGLLLFNNNKNKEAILRYKEVAAKFPNSPEAFEAVTNARNVYIDDGNLDGYVNWVGTLKFANITNQELDDTSFAIAEKNYRTSKNEKEIIKKLQKYIKDFPEGKNAIKANYYLADTYFKIKNFKKAKPYYDFIVNKAQSNYTEESLNKLAQIYLNEGDFKAALPLLKRLESEAYVSENILFAQSNLMKGYFETESYSNAINYAKKLLQKDKLELQISKDAKAIIARSSIKTEDYDTAKEYYNILEENANGELKAEALYYNAYFKNKQKDFEASNKIVQKLIANYSQFKYWGVKSYVIMGKNYYGLKDVYQATFVLENVIANFKEYEDVITEAQLELKKIKENEAKRNNSINPEKKK